MLSCFAASRLFARHASGALALAGLLAGPASAAVTISFMSGRVSRQQAGGQAWEDARLGAPLSAGDLLHTARGAKASLAYDDGSRIVLDGESTLTIREAKSDSSLVELALGTLKAFVSGVRSRRFEVKTPTAVCAVRGTEFQVAVNQQGHTMVQMFEGLLAVSDGRGNETLIKDRQSIQVTEKGLGPVVGESRQRQADARQREAMKREVSLEMSKEQVQAAAALEAKNAVYKEGKAIIDVNGDRVRIEEYIVRPTPSSFKLVVLDGRVDRFDYFYYKGIFNTALPDDLSVALRQLGGCAGAPCQYNLVSYQTGRSNTTDNVLENASGGHQIDVNNDGYANDAVTAFYDPKTDRFLALNVGAPGANNPALNDRFYKTLFDNYAISYNGIVHQSWAPAGGVTPFNGAAGTGVQNTSSGQVAYTDVTTLQQPPSCAPPNCTYTETGVEHQVFYSADGTGLIWDKYDNYIVSDGGQVAPTAAFNGLTTGSSYKQTLLHWNFEQVVTASEFGGRKIDLAVEPKIFIESGLIP